MICYNCGDNATATYTLHDDAVPVCDTCRETGVDVSTELCTYLCGSADYSAFTPDRRILPMCDACHITYSLYAMDDAYELVPDTM